MNNIGDSVFLKNRDYGVIIDKYPDKSVKIEHEGPAFERTRRIGFINGLDLQERSEFYHIMEQIKGLTDARDRYEALSAKIEELKRINNFLHTQRNASEASEDTARSLQIEKNLTNLIKYLKAELFHIGASENISPRVYTVDKDSL